MAEDPGAYPLALKSFISRWKNIFVSCSIANTLLILTHFVRGIKTKNTTKLTQLELKTRDESGSKEEKSEPIMFNWFEPPFASNPPRLLLLP